MAAIISEIWEGLRKAGLPEVMLYLPDNSASRCHWDDTALLNGVRVALVADQDRQIVRILPVDSCVGIGIASPKGVDPSGYKTFVQGKLREEAGGLPDPAPNPAEPPLPTDPEPAPVAPAEPEPAPLAAKTESMASRWGAHVRPAGGVWHGSAGAGTR